MFSAKRTRTYQSRRPTQKLNRISSIEALENRSLMAGDVAATIIGNTLFVTEGANSLNTSNDVQVSQLANGKIRVSGYSNNVISSPINGQAFVDFSIPGGASNANLVVNLRGGNDRVLVSNANLGSVSINTTNTNAVSNDTDSVDIKNVKSKSSVIIETGAGNDEVFLQNFHIGGGQVSDLTINTGSGSDVVKVGNTSSWSDVLGDMTIKTFQSLNEQDADNVSVQLTTVSKTGVIDLGGGNDKVDMLADTFGKHLVLLAGAGDDTAKLQEVQVIDDFFGYMGLGNDTLDLNYVRADEMTLLGDGGFDTLIKSADTHSRVLTQTGWSRINGRIAGLGTGIVAISANPQVRA